MTGTPASPYAEHSNLTFEGVFFDLSSGVGSNRPGMGNLLSFLNSVDAQKYVVVVDSFARLARDPSAYIKIRNKLTARGAAISTPRMGGAAHGW